MSSLKGMSGSAGGLGVHTVYFHNEAFFFLFIAIQEVVRFGGYPVFAGHHRSASEIATLGLKTMSL